MLKVVKKSQHKCGLDSLKKQKDFDFVNKHSSRFKCSCCILVISSILRPEDNKVFLGIKAGKKIGSAVIRNKVRRRIKAIFWSAINSEEASSLYGRSIIFVPYKGFDSANYYDISQEILLTLRKASAIASVKRYSAHHSKFRKSLSTKIS